MCLKNPEKIRPPKDFIVGYKFITRRQNAWRSTMASQIWHFAELVSARLGYNVNFRGLYAHEYNKGIHAYKKLRTTLSKLENLTDKSRRKHRIVKVLLFGVTCHDHESYRADHAIIIETQDPITGKRIPW